MTPLMPLKGHSRLMHSVLVPIDVRCYSDNAIIIRRSEVTLRARKRHFTCSFNRGDFDYVWYRTFSMDSNPDEV